MIKKSDNKSLITRIKSTYQDQLRSEASTTHMQHTLQFTLDDKSQGNLMKVATSKDLSISPPNKIDYDFHLLDLEKKKLHLLEGNANHVQKKFEPLRNQNIDLKDHIQAYHHYMEQQRVSLQALIQDVSLDGDDRSLLKKIGNIETLIVLLKDDQLSKSKLYGEQQQQFFLDRQLIDQLQQENKDQKTSIELLQQQQIESMNYIQIKEVEIAYIDNQLMKQSDRNQKMEITHKHEIVTLLSEIHSQNSQINYLRQVYIEFGRQQDQSKVLLNKMHDLQIIEIFGQNQQLIDELKDNHDFQEQELIQKGKIVIEKATNERKLFRQEIENITNELNLLKKINETLQLELQHQKNEGLESDTYLIGVRAQLEQLQYNFNNNIQTTQNQEVEINCLHKKIQDYEQQLVADELEIQNYKTQIQEISQKSSELQDEVFSLYDKLHDLQINYDAVIIQYKKYNALYTEQIQMSEFNKQLSRQRGDNIQMRKILSQKASNQMIENNITEEIVDEQIQLTQSSSESPNNISLKYMTIEQEYQEHSFIPTDQEAFILTVKNEEQIQVEQNDAINLINNDNELQKQRDKELLTQLKRQNQIVKLKQQLNEARTIIHQQKDKWQIVAEKLKTKYINKQSEILSQNQNQHQQQIIYLESKLLEVNSQQLSNQTDFRLKSEDNENQIITLKGINQQVQEQLREQTKIQIQLETQYKKELQKIQEQTMEKINNADKMHHIYEKQYDDYEKKLQELKKVLDQLLIKNQLTENANQLLLKKLSEADNLYQSLEYSQLKQSHDKQQQMIIQNKNNDKKIKELQKVITNAQTEIISQEKVFRKKVAEVSNIIDQMSIDNSSLQVVIVNNKDKVSRYIELKQQFAIQSEKTQKFQDQLVKASEVIKYFNQELENYKKVYNIFGPGQTLPPDSQTISPQAVVDQRLIQQKIKKQKQGQQQGLHQGMNFQSSKQIDTILIPIYKPLLPMIVQEFTVNSDRTEKKSQFDVADALKQYNSTQIVTSSSHTSPDKVVLKKKNSRSPLIRELYQQSRLLIDNLFQNSDQKTKGSKRRKSQLFLTADGRLNRSLL